VNLRIAISRGPSLAPSLELLARAGVGGDGLDAANSWPVTLADGTWLVLTDAEDVPAYVEAGAAHAGLVGKDVLLEQDRDLREVLDLRLAPGRLLYAAPPGLDAHREERLGRLRVATRYPRVTRWHFSAAGRQVEVVRVAGSPELAVLAGLADAAVLLVSGAGDPPGGLVERTEIARCSQRLVLNPAAHKLLGEDVDVLTQRLRTVREAL
jgi:ATP phosphoribosyltransferase